MTTVVKPFNTIPTSAMTALLAAQVESDAKNGGPFPDPLSLPPAEGRALAARLNMRWNEHLAPIERVETVIIPADPEVGSAETRVVVYIPETAAAGAILYAHGGGFAFGSPETHAQIAHALAHESGLPVLSVDYRLAPEHPYPAGLMDVVACLRAAFSATAGVGVRFGKLFVAGDSAGANLVTAAVLHEQAHGHALPAGALLFYAMIGDDFETASYQHFEHGPGLTKAQLDAYWSWYMPSANPAPDPMLFPLAASDNALKNLPPVCWGSAGIDPLLSDPLILAERLKSLGRTDTLLRVEGVVHGYLKMAHHLPAADDTLVAAGAMIREWLGA